MNAFPNKRSRLGFTVTEFLIVLAIVGVLLAAGIPTVLALRKTIRIAKYDGIAREIYVAAQNSLLRLAANGMDTATATNLSSASAMTGTKPADYEDAPTWDDSKGQYRCAVNGSSAMTALLPLGAIDDTIRTNGHYYVEYNVKTNIIYGVFYSDSEFEYKDVADVPNFRTDRGTRKGYMVGYYGGSAVLRNPSVYCPIPQLEIINTNILQLNILNRPKDVNIEKVMVSDGIHDPIDATILLKDDSLLMDELGDPADPDYPNRFRQRFLGLTPGADLTITVTYCEEGKIPSSASITTNSLFADRNGEWVTVSWARHLQNLNPYISNCWDSEIIYARQTAHIVWPEQYAFDSINSPYLQRYEGSYREIRSLNNCLFANTIPGMQLVGIRLVNSNITATRKGSVGALASMAVTATITNCGVYYEEFKDDGSVNFDAYAGGITADSTIGGNSEWHVGGLIGTATNCTVTNSFAALPQIDAPQGGGLIGYAENCTITGSYANCDELPLSKDFYSFLDGTGNTVTHCYAVGNVNSKTLTSSFCPAGNTVTDSYFAVSHRNYAENKDLAAAQFVTYDILGAPGNKNMEGLMAWKDGWATMIAPLTHPYREFLDGRAYPYPAFENLDHYGSWPDGDGMVTLTVDMRLLNDDTTYAIHAGTVKVYDVTDGSAPLGEPIFDSAAHIRNGKFDGNNTVPVIPGTKIKIVVTDAAGYQYVQTLVGTQAYLCGSAEQEPYTPVDGFEVRKDTNITVTFQQSTFELTCAKPIAVGWDNQEYVRGSYDVDIPGKTVHCSKADLFESVETGRTVTVRPNPPAMSSATGTVVWYTLESAPSTVYPVLQNEYGKYEFTMPGEPATLHVQFTEQVAHYTINYYLMDATEAGNYTLVGDPNQPIKADYGIGTVINQNLIDVLAANSDLLVTIDGEEVLYLDHADVTCGTTTVFSSERQDGVLTTTKGPYTTEGKDWNKDFTVNIYIARKMYNLTLEAGENINGVAFGDEAITTQSVSRHFRYGQEVIAYADVVRGQTFTAWEPDDSRFRASSSANYTFTMPNYDLTLTASARQGYYLVELSLQENGESWLASSDSRELDPVSVYLVSSSVDNPVVIPMETRTDDAVSYLVQAVVPSIPDLGEGYYIEIRYASGMREFYTRGGAYHHPDESKQSDDRVLLTVRDRAVKRDLEFFSVTYYPTAMYYLGTVPQGGTYPINHYLTVPGNIGLLRIDTEKDKSHNGWKTIFAGWKDVYAIEDSDAIYVSGETFQVTRRTDFFAEWEDSLHVTYNSNGGDGGELPVDRNNYDPKGEVTKILPGAPTRTGHTFLGWATTDNATAATYHAGDPITVVGTSVTLYAVWQVDHYTITYMDGETMVAQSKDHTYIDKEPVTIISYTAPDFLGWAEDPDGKVLYQPGDRIRLTKDLTLYARRTSQRITITYHYGQNNGTRKPIQAGVGVPGYLHVPGETTVVGWNTAPNLKGTFYPCDDTGKSLQAYAFTTNVDLYAVYGKVYNYQQQNWHNTLYDAVDKANAGETLIVYRDTTEDRQIAFTKNLYILSSGDRTVTWQSGASRWYQVWQQPQWPPWAAGEWVWTSTALEADTYEFTGCMYIQGDPDPDTKEPQPCTVVFGRSDVSGLSMEKSSLIFDANKQSRVMALGDKATFEMYDSITLTNGSRQTPNELYDRVDDSGYKIDSSKIKENKYNIRSYLGGGVYAGNGSSFRMYGGTISYCSAWSGGGVYLYPGSQMQMGNMEHPVYYSATAIYYQLDPKDNKTYKHVDGTVSPENYRRFFVTTGDPQICYCTATRKFHTTYSYADGGGGLLMLDLADGELILYRGSIHSNMAAANGGGIVTDGGADDSKLRIYEVDISHNKSENGYGGGVFQWQGNLHIYNSTLRQNYAKLDGGGIYLHHFFNKEKVENSSIQFYFGDIANNQAGRNGGGVFVENDQELMLLHGNLFKNTAAGYGGGIYMEGANSSLLLQGGSIYDNMQSYKKDNNSGAVTGTDNDVYFADSAVITVEGGTLNMTHNNPGQAKNYMVLDFNRPYSDRHVVEYKNAGDFQSADADEFQYKGNYDEYLFIAPTKAGNTLTAPLILTGTTDSTRTVVFDPNHSVGAATKHTATVGDVVDLPTGITRNGYYLYGWALSPDAYEEEYIAYYDTRAGWLTVFQDGEWTTPSAKPTYTVTNLYNQHLYAMWHPYVVNYDLNTRDLSVTIPSESVGPEVWLLAPSKNTCEDGGITYTFLGWSRDRNAKVADDNYKEGTTITLTENITLYAVWQPNIVRITYEFNGATDSSGYLSKAVTVDRGQEHTVLSAGDLNVTRAGYRFIGWNTKSDGTGETYQAEEKIATGSTTQDMTLYAMWEKVWTVSFDLQGGTWTQDTAYTVKDGDPFSIPKDAPTCGNFHFLGWSTDKDAVTPMAEYAPDRTLTVNDNVTLYAVWEKIWKVTFELGDGVWPEGVVLPDLIKDGVKITVPGEIPTLEGFEFLGWSIDPDATEPDTNYASGTEIEIHEDLTLYAIWKEKPTDPVDPQPTDPDPTDPTPEPEPEPAP